MNLGERIHGRYIHNRRARVLSNSMASLIPEHFQVLDVGCGDGLLAHLIAQKRPDLKLTGVDVLLRDRGHIPVAQFDGQSLPYGDASFDAVMFVDVLHHAENPKILLREAARVARRIIVIKDHTMEGFLAGPTLRFMDNVGNARHGVALPYDYWRRQEWLDTFVTLGLKVDVCISQLRIYPWVASWIFDRTLHFAARLNVS